MHIHLPSHQAARLFLITFGTGLAVIVVGAIIAVTLPKYHESSSNTNQLQNLSAEDLSVVSVHVQGIITELGDHSITMHTQGVTAFEKPEILVVRYTEGQLSSLDTATPPNPVNGTTATAEPITPDELHIGDVLDVQVTDLTKDTVEIDAIAVLQIR